MSAPESLLLRLHWTPRVPAVDGYDLSSVIHCLWISLNKVMPTACGKRMLVRLYQTLIARATAARDTRRTTELDIPDSFVAN